MTEKSWSEIEIAELPHTESETVIENKVEPTLRFL